MSMALLPGLVVAVLGFLALVANQFLDGPERRIVRRRVQVVIGALTLATGLASTLTKAIQAHRTQLAIQATASATLDRVIGTSDTAAVQAVLMGLEPSDHGRVGPDRARIRDRARLVLLDNWAHSWMADPDPGSLPRPVLEDSLRVLCRLPFPDQPTHLDSLTRAWAFSRFSNLCLEPNDPDLTQSSLACADSAEVLLAAASPPSVGDHALIHATNREAVAEVCLATQRFARADSLLSDIVRECDSALSDANTLHRDSLVVCRLRALRYRLQARARLGFRARALAEAQAEMRSALGGHPWLRDEDAARLPVRVAEELLKLQYTIGACYAGAGEWEQACRIYASSVPLGQQWQRRQIVKPRFVYYGKVLLGLALAHVGRFADGLHHIEDAEAFFGVRESSAGGSHDEWFRNTTRLARLECNVELASRGRIQSEDAWNDCLKQASLCLAHMRLNPDLRELARAVKDSTRLSRLHDRAGADHVPGI